MINTDFAIINDVRKGNYFSLIPGNGSNLNDFGRTPAGEGRGIGSAFITPAVTGRGSATIIISPLIEPLPNKEDILVKR